MSRLAHHFFPYTSAQVTEFLGAGARQFGFMVRGLKELQPKLEALNIPFFLLKGESSECASLDASVAVIMPEVSLSWRTSASPSSC